MIELGTVLATAAVTGLVQVGVWAAIQRSIECRDRKMEELERDLAQVKKQELVDLKERVTAGSVGREKIYRLLETEYTRRTECDRTHEQENKQLSVFRNELGTLADDVKEIRQQTASNTAILNLIARRLEIKLEN